MKNVLKEKEIVKRLVNGDSTALEDVISLYQTKIFNTANNIVKNHNDAQEITQDVLFTIFRKIDSFKGNSSFFTWIYRITVNYAFMKLRSRRKEKHIPIEEAHPDSEETFLAAVLPDKSKYADDRVVEKEFMEKVLRSVDELPTKYRQVFQLRDLQDFSNEEVGQMLHLSLAAVKSRIHRARLFLREKISDFSEGLAS